MTCNYCGSNWAKDISTKELREEIERRKVCVDDAWKEYVDRAYPSFTRSIWLMILNFHLAFIGSGMLLTALPASLWLSLSHYAGLVQFILAVCVFIVLFSPGIYLFRKANRIRTAFWKEHPEHVEAYKE